MSKLAHIETASEYLGGHNEWLQDKYQRDACEVDTMVAVISQASDLLQLHKLKRDPLHFIFIIDDPILLEYNYLEQFKNFIIGYTVKKYYITQEDSLDDIFSIYISFCKDQNDQFIPLVQCFPFSGVQNEDSFYQIFNQQVLLSPEVQIYISSIERILAEQKEANPIEKLLQVYNLAYRECNDLNYNNSIVFISSMINCTPALAVSAEKQFINLLPSDQDMHYNFKLNAISLRKNSSELLQKLTSQTLGYYFYAQDILKQLLLYSLDQILIQHTKTYIKNYKIELTFEDSHNLIKSVSPCSKWVVAAVSESGNISSIKIQQKYFTAKEEKISLVSLTLNPTLSVPPGTYKVGKVTHSFQLPSYNKRVSFISDVVVTLTNEAAYQFNPQCYIFYEQCLFVQLGQRILYSLLQLDWAAVDQLLPRLRQVFSTEYTDSIKNQNLIKSSRFLLERISVFKLSFSPQIKSHPSSFLRETISKDECYNQIFKMIEYLHNINHFLVNLG